MVNEKPSPAKKKDLFWDQICGRTEPKKKVMVPKKRLKKQKQEGKTEYNKKNPPPSTVHVWGCGPCGGGDVG